MAIDILKDAAMSWGPVWATALSSAQTVAQDWFSARQARNQMDFQQQMSDTAFQRRAADLSAAGMNPLLAGSVGPAGVGSGAMAQSAPFEMVSSALQANMNAAQVKLLDAQASDASNKARISNVDANVAESQEKARESMPASLRSLPREIGGPVSAAAEAVRPLADRIFGLLPDGSEDVQRMLQGGRGDNSAVSGSRSSGSSVLPGGAVVGRPVPGQLNVLRLKRSSGE